VKQGNEPNKSTPGGSATPRQGKGRTSRQANRKSVGNRRLLAWSVLFGFAILALAFGTWLWMNRERPLVELSVAAGPYRSDSYELMVEAADVVARQSSILRLKVMPTTDSSKNISLLNSGTADLATIRSDTPVAQNVNMVADLFPDFFQVFFRPQSGIARVRDLSGKIVAIPPFGTDEFRSFWAIADHYDLSLTEVKWRAMPFAEASDKLLHGEIDALFTVRSLRDRLVLNMVEDSILKRVRLSVLAIDQAPAIQVKRPFLSHAVIPKGVYGGNPVLPALDTLSSSVTRTLVTRNDLDTELIRELTRILFENRLDLVIRFALASAITKPPVDEGLSVPLHPGAEQYYNRDQPSFLQENAEPLALIVTLAAMLGSGLVALRSRLLNNQKNRMDSYNFMLLDIADQAQSTERSEDIEKLKQQLFGILETVVRALDTDEVTEEGFQSFSLLWESVRELINDRYRQLREQSGA